MSGVLTKRETISAHARRRRRATRSPRASACLFALLLGLTACSSNEPESEPAQDGSGGNAGGSGGKSGSSGAGGVTAGAGGQGGRSGSGGSATGGKAGGQSSGGKAGTGGASSGGTSSGAAGRGGEAGSSVTAGSGGEAGGTTYDCGLPELGSNSVERPTGEPGGLRVLDWAGFQGAVTYSFDDANSSQIEHYAELNALGVPFTFYLLTEKEEAASDIWATAVADGHELGNHTQTHPYDATTEEVDGATAFIESRFGVKVWTMAAPFGDESYIPFAESRFLINRGAFDAQIFPDDDSDPYNLPCFAPDEEAPASDLDEKVDAARAYGAWQIMLIHGFTGGDDAAFQPIAIDEFVASVEHAKSLEALWLDTVVSIGSYFRGQRAFVANEPTTDGDNVRYEWELPDHFPPGKCLRVTVTGGTLEQDGQPVPWNERGYYEISLDAETLTLSP